MSEIWPGCPNLGHITYARLGLVKSEVRPFINHGPYIKLLIIFIRILAFSDVKLPLKSWFQQISKIRHFFS